MVTVSVDSEQLAADDMHLADAAASGPETEEESPGKPCKPKGRCAGSQRQRLK